MKAGVFPGFFISVYSRKMDEEFLAKINALQHSHISVSSFVIDSRNVYFRKSL